MPNDQSAREFVLLKFAKGEDRPCGKVSLAGLSLDEAQRMTGEKASNPMYDSYPVSERSAREAPAGVAEPPAAGRGHLTAGSGTAGSSGRYTSTG